MEPFQPNEVYVINDADLCKINISHQMIQNGICKSMLSRICIVPPYSVFNGSIYMQTKNPTVRVLVVSKDERQYYTKQEAGMSNNEVKPVAPVAAAPRVPEPYVSIVTAVLALTGKVVQLGCLVSDNATTDRRILLQLREVYWDIYSIVDDWKLLGLAPLIPKVDNTIGVPKLFAAVHKHHAELVTLAPEGQVLDGGMQQEHGQQLVVDMLQELRNLATMVTYNRCAHGLQFKAFMDVVLGAWCRPGLNTPPQPMTPTASSNAKGVTESDEWTGHRQ